VHRKFNELMEKGIVLKTGDDQDEQVYIAESPDRLLFIIRRRMQEVEGQRRTVNDMIQHLRALHKTASARPHVRYIETVEGLRLIQQEFEEMGEDVLQIVGYDTYVQLHGADIADEHREVLKNKKKKIRSILVTDSKVSLPPNIEFVALSPSMMPVTGEVSVCGNRVIMFSYISGLVAVEITSKSIADTMRATLELAWQRAKGLAGE